MTDPDVSWCDCGAAGGPHRHFAESMEASMDERLDRIDRRLTMLNLYLEQIGQHLDFLSSLLHPPVLDDVQASEPERSGCLQPEGAQPDAEVPAGRDGKPGPPTRGQDPSGKAQRESNPKSKPAGVELEGCFANDTTVTSGTG